MTSQVAFAIPHEMQRCGVGPGRGGDIGAGAVAISADGGRCRVLTAAPRSVVVGAERSGHSTIGLFG